MRALVFRYSLPRLASARILGLITPRAYLGPFGAIRLGEIPEPKLLGDAWTLVRTTLCGICGSDVKQVFLDGNIDNPLTALITFPQVLGHEAVGVIERVGPGVVARRVGERVALNPWLSCGPRGIDPPCPACREGHYSLCEHFTDGALPTGLHHGNCRVVTGAYAPLFPAHESQLIPIPDGVSVEQAVFADPFSVSLHAILKAPPRGGALALVYGAGVLGLLSVAILRTLYPAVRVAIVARYPHQADAARRFGAHEVITARKPAQVVEAVAGLASVPVLRPANGLPWLLRGADVVYDTVGSPETLTVDVRVASARAPVVITGVGVPARWEWTPHYFKEVTLMGSNAFGVEELDGLRMHAMAHYLRLVAQGRFDLSPLITHRFRLDAFAQAFTTLHAKGKHRAVKGVFDFRAN